METYQERVIKERTELGQKLVALVEFIVTNPVFGTLPEQDQYLLRRQSYLMNEYHEVLTKRIENFQKERSDSAVHNPSNS